MPRHSRLVMLILVAMFAVAVPTAGAQTSPVGDQYQTEDPGGTTADDGGTAADDAGTAADNGVAPVEVSDVTSSATESLPFTGGQVALVALIGLALLALGCAGLAATRRRERSSAA